MKHRIFAIIRNPLPIFQKPPRTFRRTPHSSCPRPARWCSRRTIRGRPTRCCTRSCITNGRCRRAAHRHHRQRYIEHTAKTRCRITILWVFLFLNNSVLLTTTKISVAFSRFQCFFDTNFTQNSAILENVSQ